MKMHPHDGVWDSRCNEVNESNEYLRNVGGAIKTEVASKRKFLDGLKTCTRPPTPVTAFWWSQQMKITLFGCIHKIDWVVKVLWDPFSFWQYVGAWRRLQAANSNARLKFPVAPIAVKQTRKPRFKNVLALVHYPGGCVINVHSSVV